MALLACEECSFVVIVGGGILNGGDVKANVDDGRRAMAADAAVVERAMDFIVFCMEAMDVLLVAAMKYYESAGGYQLCCAMIMIQDQE